MWAYLVVSNYHNCIRKTKGKKENIYCNGACLDISAIYGNDNDIVLEVI